MLRRESSGASAVNAGKEEEPLISATIGNTKYSLDMSGFHESSVGGGKNVDKEAEGSTTATHI
jgi:hypothetical protein